MHPFGYCPFGHREARHKRVARPKKNTNQTYMHGAYKSPNGVAATRRARFGYGGLTQSRRSNSISRGSPTVGQAMTRLSLSGDAMMVGMPENLGAKA